MDISIKNNQTNFNGWQEAINIMNPISHKLNRYLVNSARNSQKIQFQISPALEGKIRFASMKSGFNTHISAWDINPNNSDNYVLFLHGMAQNVASEQRLYSTVAEKNLGVFALEYRGYGANELAHVDEHSLNKDVETAFKYLTKEKGIQPQNIIVMGHSMGGALATTLTSKHPDLKSLVLISPITSAYGLSDKFMLHKNFGIGASEKLYEAIKKINILQLLISFRFNSMAKAKKIEVPTYIIQTKNDSITPYKNARLFANKLWHNGALEDFITLPVGGHNIDYRKIQTISNILDKING